MKAFNLRQSQIDKLRSYSYAAASYATIYAAASYAAYAYAAQAAPNYAEEVKAKVERNYCLIEIMFNINGYLGD